MGSKNDFVPKTDGVNHINIYTLGKTSLGKKLHHFRHMPFVHPVLGKFNSMEGLWHYVKMTEPDDAIRRLSGYDAKKFALKKERELGSKSVRRLDDFYDIINEANYYRITQNQQLCDEFVASTLPFDHYYIHGERSLIVRPAEMRWLVNGYEELRVLIREGKQPKPANLDQFFELAKTA